MYKVKKAEKTKLNVNNQYVGETIIDRVRRIYTTGEPISDGVEPFYTEKKDGVLPETNIRSDKFDLAAEALDKRNEIMEAARKKKDEVKKADEEKTLGEKAKDGMKKEGEE